LVELKKVAWRVAFLLPVQHRDSAVEADVQPAELWMRGADKCGTRTSPYGGMLPCIQHG